MKANRHVPRGIEILHDDRDLYVISKQAGILTTGTGRAGQFTAEQAMNDYIRKGNDKVPKQVYLVHRIDRETSGLLLFAKSALAQSRLQQDWDRRPGHRIVHQSAIGKCTTLRHDSFRRNRASGRKGACSGWNRHMSYGTSTSWRG